jgi:hypothetical protein
VYYIFAIVGLVAVGVCVVLLYRDRLKKDMSKEMKMQVATAVEHYYALS